MRYTNGLNINLSAYGKEKNTNIEYKHDSKAKKKECKQLLNNNKVIVSDDLLQNSTFETTTNSKTLQREENKSPQVLSTVSVTTHIAKRKQKMQPKLTKTSDASLQKVSHNTYVNQTSERDISRGKIMLIALSTNLLAVIGLVALTTTIIGGTNIIGFVIAGICAFFGVAFAKYGYEEAQNDTFGFFILYTIATLPGFLVNSIILIILGIGFF
jgi:hypothetical protein